MGIISVEEWLAELEKIHRENRNKSDGFTMKEISARIGRSVETSRGIVAKLIQRGCVEPCMVHRMSILTSVMRPVPGYKLIPKKKRKA